MTHHPTHPTHNHGAATRQNIKRCSNCHGYLPTLIAVDALHFCGEECTHEWSSKIIAAATPEEAHRILNDLRQYLKAKIAGQGEETAFTRLCMNAMQMFRELDLQRLCPAPLVLDVVTADAEKEVDASLRFP